MTRPLFMAQFSLQKGVELKHPSPPGLQSDWQAVLQDVGSGSLGHLHQRLCTCEHAGERGMCVYLSPAISQCWCKLAT
jgi:hypothetical protein